MILDNPLRLAMLLCSVRMADDSIVSFCEHLIASSDDTTPPLGGPSYCYNPTLDLSRRLWNPPITFVLQPRI